MRPLCKTFVVTVSVKCLGYFHYTINLKHFLKVYLECSKCLKTEALALVPAP